MELIYASDKIEEQCTNKKMAKKLFGGNEMLVRSLFSRINLLEQATSFNDIILMPMLHFHKLYDVGRRKLEGYFAIDVKSRKEAWRIVLEPLNENKEPFVPCNIDEVASSVRIVKIVEVSNHYG